MQLNMFLWLNKYSLTINIYRRTIKNRKMYITRQCPLQKYHYQIALVCHLSNSMHVLQRVLKRPQKHSDVLEVQELRVHELHSWDICWTGCGSVCLTAPLAASLVGKYSFQAPVAGSLNYKFFLNSRVVETTCQWRGFVLKPGKSRGLPDSRNCVALVIMPQRFTEYQQVEVQVLAGCWHIRLMYI